MDTNGDNLKLLRYAILKGDLEKIQQLLHEHDIDVSTINKNGDSLLHSVFKFLKCLPNQTIDIFKILINRGADPNILNNAQESVLHLAIAKQSKDIIEFFIENGGNIDMTDNEGNTLAHYFIQNLFGKLKAASEIDEVNSTCFVETIEEDNVTFVEWLLSKGFNFDVRNKKGQSALHMTIAYNLQHLLPSLLMNTRDINFISQYDKQTLLQLFLNISINAKNRIIRNNNVKSLEVNENSEFFSKYRISSNSFTLQLSVEIVKMLIERGVIVENIDSNGLTALNIAIDSEEQLEIVEILFNRFTKLENKYCMLLLHSMADKPTSYWSHLNYTNDNYYIKIFQLLISKGANVNSKDENGMSLVYYAIKHGNLQLIEMMKAVDSVDFSVITNNGENLLHAFTEIIYFINESNFHDREVIFDMLISHCCDVNAKNKQGQTPLLWAVKNGNCDIVSKLIAQGADVNCQDYEKKFSPLHVAAQSDSVEMVKLLLDNGANVNCRTVEGVTPLHLSVLNVCRQDITFVLLERKAEVNVTDIHGDTPLAKILNIGTHNNLEPLLMYGADINVEGVTRQLKQCWNKNVGNMLLEHATKLKGINLSCSEHYEEFIKSNEYLNAMYNHSLKQEIEIMKKTLIDDCTSFYDWLHMDLDQRYTVKIDIHCQDEKLRDIVDLPKLKRQFPEYWMIIIGKYNETLARKAFL